MLLLITYLFIAIGFSFLCSILEAVLLSTPASYIEVKLQEERRGASKLKEFKESIDTPLAAILTINTIAHTIGAAGVGAQATKVFGEDYFGIISAILTLMILVFSEIIPKTIGATYWKNLAIPSVKILHIMILISFPFVWLSEKITGLISKKKDQYTFSRKEMTSIASIAQKEGVLAKSESKLIYNLINLHDIKVEHIMTPRTVIVAADENLTAKEFTDQLKNFFFSRIPVYEKHPENITGYVLKADVLTEAALDNHDVKLKELKREVPMVFESMSVPNLFKSLLNKNNHIAIVVDEYGGVEGLVTLEDVVETLTGIEIVDEMDTHVDYQKMARELWEKRLKQNRNDFIGYEDKKENAGNPE